MLGVIASLVEMTIGEGGKEGEGRKNVWRGGEMGGGGWELNDTGGIEEGEGGGRPRPEKKFKSHG